MTDLINEYYGIKGVRFLSWMTIGLICFGFLMVFGAMKTVPNEWWITSKKVTGVENMSLCLQRNIRTGPWYHHCFNDCFFGCPDS
jgi:hypothetical protein